MSDKLTIEKGQLTLTTDEGQKIQMPEEKLLEMMRREIEPPINGEALPDGVKFMQWQRPFLCVVHQMSAHVRQLRWIEDDSPVPFGPGTKFKTRRLSLPYAITLAVYFSRGEHLSLMGYNELYFRNQPLTSIEDKLGYPALLNVSRIDSGKRSRSWICTQYLKCPPQTPWTTQLASLLDHTWNGAFNRSSEHHEGASWYGESTDVHKDLHPIANWEKASEKNDAFAISVPWKPVKLNVGQLIDAMLSECRSSAGGTMLARQVSRKSKPVSIVARFLNLCNEKTQKKHNSKRVAERMINQIPIYLKDSADMPRPTDAEYYLMTGDGVFMGRNHQFFTSDVLAPRMPRSLASHSASCLVNYPKLGVAALEYIVGFFDQVFERHGSESIVLLFWNQTSQRYKLYVPKQEATVWESYSGYRSAMDVSYELPIPMPRDHLLVADIHCHCDFAAYTSFKDAKDEEYRDGVHAVVGHIDRDQPDFHVEISIDGSRFNMKFDQLFKGFNKRRVNVPSEWFDQLTVKVNRPQAWSWPAR